MANMKKEKKLLKKKLIAEKAIELITEKGLNNFTMQDVAQKCNVSKGTLYLYYKNKNSLIISAFGILVEKLKKTFIYETKDVSIPQKADFILNTYSEILNKFPSKDLMKILEILISSIHDEEMMEELTNIFSTYYSQTLDFFETVFGSRQKSLLIHAMFDGLAIYKALGVNFCKDDIENDFKEMILKIYKK
ncbi:hypothetical protein OSSY52_20800 [Tepiditoga spiralis]|uniref:HTH tetR-type domain-containing protein n=1 Tax=Tepiditoga spiralis TaxID=2108365 RepID=A0A7G1GC89_9BACT|nr:TetR/AcrR family transcriptional regulator [Tepiditoga spiralis]BBE31939.1 hypothetical protein OSSY52_20800 [Tepiditoga spiralis]